MTSETSAPVDDYLQTDYVVIHDRVEITVRIGEFNAELDRLLAEIGASSGIFITGWNPYSREEQPEANTAANERMAAVFAGRGIRVLPHVGRSPEGNWFEEGFFALNLDPEDALAVARAFRQIAIVHAPAGEPAQLLLTGAQWTTSPPTG